MTELTDAFLGLGLNAYNLGGGLLGLLDILHEWERKDLLDRVVLMRSQSNGHKREMEGMTYVAEEHDESVNLDLGQCNSEFETSKPLPPIPNLL